VFYVLRPGMADRLAERLGLLYRVVYSKYFVDEIYRALVVRPLVGGSREVLWKSVDVGVIDGAVNGIGARARGIGAALRRLQSGYIRSYATWVVLGALALLVAMGTAGGTR
jgi:NADH-quinone oxidoreductase subunit L